MKCSQIIEKLEELAPISYACEWDNPGLLVGSGQKEVKKILIALDATEEVINRAVIEKVDLLLTHHPLIFKPLKQINDENFIGRRLLTLIRHDISYYAMHTNFDIAPGGMADLAADLLELRERKVLEPMVEDKGGIYGIGRVGELRTEMSVQQLGNFVKEIFELPFLIIYGKEAVTVPIRRVAVSPGSGSGMMEWGLKSGAQVLITGDIGHHEGIDAAANRMTVFDGGHYGLEHIFIPHIAAYLKDHLEEKVELIQAKLSFPSEVL